MNIIGISAFYHDSAASLVVDGEIISAVQEERFTRVKNDKNFPINSIKYILEENNLNIEDIDAFVFYEKPLLKFERLIETYLAFSPMGLKSFIKAIPLWIKEKLYQKEGIINEIKKTFHKKIDGKKIFFSEHHLSHAASAYYPSSFNEAIVLTLDGVGEFSSTVVYHAKDNRIEKVKELHFPHSLGLLYSAFTYFLGFQVNEGEYKVMGLAPYGNPKFKDLILKHLIDVKEDGSYQLNMKYFNYSIGLTMTNKKFQDLIGFEKREPKDKLLQNHMDLAASIQSVAEDIILKITRNLKQEYKINNLCLAGGVALNCVANGKILKEKIFENIWIQPAAGDAGGSLGAALAFYYLSENKIKEKKPIISFTPYLGPKFTNEKVKIELDNLKANYKYYEDEELFEFVSKKIMENKALGWFQGRMEFGPRALGARSILANAKSLDMQRDLNLKVKFRESFRPFAPAIMQEFSHSYFDFDENFESPYMLLVTKVKNNKNKTSDFVGFEKLKNIDTNIPAVTHVDYTARVQTVSKESNERFYSLLKKMNSEFDTPLVVNTSFNVNGEPIVCSVKDAFSCFMNTNLDFLVCENYILNKKDQFQ
tara:strand:- start:92 stop:1873 length:1782 start_codon:yes stop_codon:yes gene_type:complete